MEQLQQDIKLLTPQNFKEFKVGDMFQTRFYTAYLLVTFQVTELNDTQIIAKQYDEHHGLIGKETWFWITKTGFIQNNRYR